MESTADLINNARKEQIAARSAGDEKAEKTWSEAINRLIDIHLQETERLHGNRTAF